MHVSRPGRLKRHLQQVRRLALQWEGGVLRNGSPTSFKRGREETPAAISIVSSWNRTNLYTAHTHGELIIVKNVPITNWTHTSSIAFGEFNYSSDRPSICWCLSLPELRSASTDLQEICTNMLKLVVGNAASTWKLSPMVINSCEGLTRGVYRLVGQPGGVRGRADGIFMWQTSTLSHLVHVHRPDTASQPARSGKVAKCAGEKV